MSEAGHQSSAAAAGSKWDVMLSLFLNKKELFHKNLLNFEHELVTMRNLCNSPVIGQTISKWIESLDETNNRSTQTTNEFRTKGNEYYKTVALNGAESIEFYTKAVFSAPKGSKELGLAHANRAAALIALDYYEEAYNDCTMAIQNAYPKENLLKVLWRQATCSVFLKNRDNLLRNITEIEEILLERAYNSVNEEKVTEFKSELKKLEMSSEKPPRKDAEQPIKEKKLIEKSSKDLGRFILTEEVITENEPILQERAFAFIPVYEKFSENPIDYNCQNCARTNIIPFPCYDCGRASYCCPKCATAHREVHRVECAGYRKHLWYEIGIAHLSLRTMLCGFADAVNELETVSDANPIKLWNELLLASEENSKFLYGRVFRLVTNYKKMNKDDYLRYALTAVMLTIYLKNFTQFFQQLPQKCTHLIGNKADWELFVAALIMRHMGQLVCNGHAISDLSLTTPSEFNGIHSKDMVRLGMLHCYIQSSRIFTAIFPRISLFNHSCDPNIRNRFDGSVLTVFATRKIEANEEIFNCYGPNYRLMERDERQYSLRQQYCFDCNCLKCMRGIDDLLDSYQTYMCKNEDCLQKIPLRKSHTFWWRKNEPSPVLLCPSCHNRLNLDWHPHFNNLFDQMKMNHMFEYTCNQAYEIYENVTRFMSEHHEQKMDMAQIILNNFVLLTGNDLKFNLNKKLTKLAVDNLGCCESRFGRFSMEYIIASSILLDLLAIRKKIEKNLQSDYNLDSVRETFAILSSNSNALFKNYLNNYILNVQ